jgi:hypothetical protein
MNDPSTIAVDLNESALANDSSAIDLDDDDEDFKEFLAKLDEPLPSEATTGLPGDGIVFDSGDFPTEEEAEAAHEAFLMKAFGVSDEDD